MLALICSTDTGNTTSTGVGKRSRPDNFLALYGAVGWSAYTKEPGALRAAIAGSSYVVTARRGGQLVGLAGRSPMGSPSATYKTFSFTQTNNGVGWAAHWSGTCSTGTATYGRRSC